MKIIMSARPERKDRCFTLIELLVVIAIIAILAAMLLPALNKTKGQAKTSQCVSQFKQVSTAFQGYLSSYNDHLPPLQYGDKYDNMGSTLWPDLMSKELGLERTIGKKYFNGKQKNHVLVCPARTVRESSWGNWDGITLAYNQDTKDDGTFRLPKANSVKKTSLQLVFVDSWYDRNTTLGRNLGRYRLPSNQSVAFPHQKRSVALYLDGHAALEFQQWLRLNNQYYYPINLLLSEQAPRLGSTEPLTSFAPFD